MTPSVTDIFSVPSMLVVFTSLHSAAFFSFLSIQKKQQKKKPVHTFNKINKISHKLLNSQYLPLLSFSSVSVIQVKLLKTLQ